MKIGGDDGNPNPKAGRKAGQADETFLLPTYQLLNMYGTNLLINYYSFNFRIYFHSN
jgi:hypothetical protein